MYAITIAGHGSRHRFEGSDPQTPRPEDLIEDLDKAIGEARTLEAQFDPYVSCMVVDASTMEIKYGNPGWNERKGDIFTPSFGDPHPKGSWQAAAGLG